MAEELEFKQEELFENLDEKAKTNLLADCSVIFSNESFKKISDEIYTRAVVKTIKGTKDEFDSNQGITVGIKEFFDTIYNYHIEYLASKKKPEPFDSYKAI